MAKWTVISVPCWGSTWQRSRQRGYKVADADIVLTNASNDGGQILFKSFRYDWGEAGSTTWDALETEIMAAVGTKTVVSGGLPSLGGKKPFELHDYQAV